MSSSSIMNRILVEHYFKAGKSGEMVEYWLYADREPYLRSLPEWARVHWNELLDRRESELQEAMEEARAEIAGKTRKGRISYHPRRQVKKKGKNKITKIKK